MILVDTNVFVDILQETPAGQKAVETIEAADPEEKFAYSVITWFELCAYPRQRESVRELLQGFKAVPLTLSVAESAAGIYLRHLSGNRRHIPDALIAASALALDASLWTLNRSDFRRIPRLKLFSA